jgi:hypothetical protein
MVVKLKGTILRKMCLKISTQVDTPNYSKAASIRKFSYNPCKNCKISFPSIVVINVLTYHSGQLLI